MSVDYHQMSNFIGARLPGTGVWLHCVPTEETYGPASPQGPAPNHEHTYPIGEGLAIRRDGTEDSFGTDADAGGWIVLYFSIHEITQESAWGSAGDESAEGLEDEGLEDEGLEDEGLEDEGLEDEGLEDEGLSLSIGFIREYDTLGQAKAEARELVGYLPVPESVGEEESRRMHDLVFAAIDSLDD